MVLHYNMNWYRIMYPHLEDGNLFFEEWHLISHSFLTTKPFLAIKEKRDEHEIVLVPIYVYFTFDLLMLGSASKGTTKINIHNDVIAIWIYTCTHAYSYKCKQLKRCTCICLHRKVNIMPILNLNGPSDWFLHMKVIAMLQHMAALHLFRVRFISFQWLYHVINTSVRKPLHVHISTRV